MEAVEPVVFANMFLGTAQSTATVLLAITRPLTFLIAYKGNGRAH